jgi:AcrR family transcriptional regulator
VSRRTFYELFANREECLAGVLEGMVGVIARELAGARLEGLAWRERVRCGLWAILSLFDREPALARVCVVGALGGSPAVLERREQLLAVLAGVVDEGRLQGARGRDCTPLTAEGLVGAAFAIVHARVLCGGRVQGGGARGERAPLKGLLGDLMGMIVLPYLGPAAARRELARPAPVSVGGVIEPAGRVMGDPLDGVTMRLTYRTTKVLEAVAEVAGANNRQVAKRAGISDQGQVSKLLARLERLGLLENTSEGHAKGEPNAWSLTAKGDRVVRSIRAHTPGRREVA